MTSSRMFGLVALALALLIVGAADAQASRRVALVIGNDDYRELPALQKAGADATDFAALLREKQFDEVLLQRNLTRLEMDLAVSDFLETISPGDTAVFFYSGHGWSDGSQNFLVGTDVPKDAGGVALARLSIPLQNGANGVIDEMAQHGATLKIVIVDACRDNPFASEVAGRSVGMGRGLARVDPPRGTFVVFSAGTGQVALDRLSDSDANRNSVFTRTLLPLVRSDLPLLEAVKTTQEKVYELARQVHHEQEPAYYDQVRGDACLSLSCSGAETPAATPAAEPRGPAINDEMRFWIAIQNSSNPAEYVAFLERFPNGDLGTLARIRLESIEPGFWESVSGNGRQSDLERYLELYPDGRHAEEARARLADLRQAATAPPPPAPEAPPPQPAAPEEADVALAVTGETPPETTPELDASGNPTLSGKELIVALQEVLKRAGCYTSRIDGLWGRRSQAGLENLLKRSDIDAAPEPTAETFALIEEVDERVCPVQVAPKPRTVTAPKQQRQPTVTQQQPVQTQQQPETQSWQSNGNPRANCGGILSPADPNYQSPGTSRRTTGSC